MATPESTSREIEAKFAVRTPARGRLLLEVLGVPKGDAGTEIPVRDVYYDTPDHALLAAGFTFRMRERPEGGYEATVKTLSACGRDGVYDREERTEVVPHARPEPALLPDGPLRATLEAVAGRRALVRLARVTGVRHQWRVASAPRVRALVTSDRIRIQCGTVSFADAEIEVELERGPRPAFLTWVAQAKKQARAPASPGSKLERALKRARIEVPSPSRVAAARLALRPSAAGEAFASEALAQGFARLAPALDAALHGARRGAVEGVHDVRTVSRRLRALISAHGPEIPDAARQDLRTRLTALRRAAGPMRDLDVTKDLLAATEVSPELAPGLAALRAAASTQRGLARKAFNEALSAPRLSTLPEKIASLATDSLSRPSPRLAIAGATRLPPELEEPLARREALGGTLEAAPAAVLHEWRISIKRARYAAENFAPAFGRPVSRFAQALRDLQDALGEIHDADAARSALDALLRRVPRDDPRADAAVGAAAAVAESLDRRASKLRRRLPELANAALSADALRDLYDHLARRAAIVAEGS